MLPPFVRDALARQGRAVREATPVPGGEISVTLRVETEDGPFFLKYQGGPAAVPFTAERIGLDALRGSGTVRVPAVLAEESGPGGAFLLLEWVPGEPPRNPAAFRDRFAERLAALHRTRPDGGAGYGFPSDNYIGLLPQKNGPRAGRWADFYRDCRLFPQIEIARRRGRLVLERERLLMGLVARLPVLFDGLPEEASLLHGDLWSGNFLCAPGDAPVLIDPSVYYGHREVEMAFIQLFGGFPPGFVEAYQAAWPLDAGYERRRALHQLYPLLVHLNHFGEQYGPRVEAVCREYMWQPPCIGP